MLKRSGTEPLADSVFRPYHGGGRGRTTVTITVTATATATATAGTRARARARALAMAVCVCVCVPLLLELDKGGDGLQAAVVGARVHNVHGGVYRHEMLGELPRLIDPVGGEGRVHRDSCW